MGRVDFYSSGTSTSCSLSLSFEEVESERLAMQGVVSVGGFSNVGKEESD
jgi:hypothetical protein